MLQAYGQSSSQRVTVPFWTPISDATTLEIRINGYEPCFGIKLYGCTSSEGMSSWMIWLHHDVIFIVIDHSPQLNNLSQTSASIVTPASSTYSIVTSSIDTSMTTTSIPSSMVPTLSSFETSSSLCTNSVVQSTITATNTIQPSFFTVTVTEQPSCTIQPSFVTVTVTNQPSCTIQPSFATVAVTEQPSCSIQPSFTTVTVTQQPSCSIQPSIVTVIVTDQPSCTIQPSFVIFTLQPSISMQTVLITPTIQCGNQESSSAIDDDSCNAVAICVPVTIGIAVIVAVVIFVVIWRTRYCRKLTFGVTYPRLVHVDNDLYG